MTTSITFHHRPSLRGDGHPGKLFIRIIRARKSRHIFRNYPVYSDEWDAEKKQIIFPSTDNNPGGVHHPNPDGVQCPKPDEGCCSGSASGRVPILALIDESMKNDLKRLREIVSRLSENGDYSASDVVERFADSLNHNTVGGYAAVTAARLREQGRGRTARAYRSAARSFTIFNGGGDVPLSRIDARTVAEYEKYMLDKKLKLNTVSFYLRNLRAIYFRAVAQKIIPRQVENPFSGLHTGVYETRRRALDDRQLKSLAGLENMLSEKGVAPAAQLHDSLLYFMFCYHARGMSFVDMAHLRKEDIGAESFSYRRRKTGGLFEIRITEPMRRILTHFTLRSVGSEYVFPVIDSRKARIHSQYETGLKRQNRLLKILAGMAGIAESLSTHAARHTWATMAKRMHVPVAVIGEALGHRDVKTTSIYLASFDRATMDDLSVKLSDAAKVA